MAGFGVFRYLQLHAALEREWRCVSGAGGALVVSVKPQRSQVYSEL